MHCGVGVVKEDLALLPSVVLNVIKTFYNLCILAVYRVVNNFSETVCKH